MAKRMYVRITIKEADELRELNSLGAKERYLIEYGRMIRGDELKKIIGTTDRERVIVFRPFNDQIRLAGHSPEPDRRRDRGRVEGARVSSTPTPTTENSRGMTDIVNIDTVCEALQRKWS